MSAKHHKEQTLILPPATAAQRIASGSALSRLRRDHAAGRSATRPARHGRRHVRFAAGRLTEPFVVGSKGFDADTGYGFVNAVKAISKVKRTLIQSRSRLQRSRFLPLTGALRA